MEFHAVKDEKSRTYVFTDGKFTVENVTKVSVRDSGSHRLETNDGKKYIVRAGWLAIEINANNWSF